MNEKLLAIGVAAALIAPVVVQADVEIYGDARVSVDYATNNDDGTGTGSCNYDSATSSNDPAISCQKSKGTVSSNASYIGFKGDEDLGNGMAALWQLEQGVEFDSGKAFSEDRPTFVGIGGGFGTVMAGRFDTPYMSATDIYDIFKDTKADYNAIMGAANSSSAIYDSRVSNTLLYASPDLGGFKAELAYTMSQAFSSDNLPISKRGGKKDAYSLGGNYDNGPFSLGGAYQVVSRQGSNNDDIIGWKLGGSYTILDTTTLALIYENLDLGGTIKARDAYYFSVAHRSGNTTWKLAFANAGKCGGSACAKTGATQIAAGVTQSMTMNTELYVLYTQVSNDSGARYGLAYGPANAVTGKDESVLSLGINHKFSSR
ncbi:MAG: porin [Gammaproteobacteria bacterium]|jgi:predicted porin